MAGESDGSAKGAKGEKRPGDNMSSPFDNKSRKTVDSPPGGILLPDKGDWGFTRPSNDATQSAGLGGSVGSSVCTMASVLSDVGVEREAEVPSREEGHYKEGAKVDYGAEIGNSLRHFLFQPSSSISKAAALVIMNKYAELDKLFIDWCSRGEG